MISGWMNDNLMHNSMKYIANFWLYGSCRDNQVKDCDMYSFFAN